MDEPIPHKKFMFLGEESYEITGGSARPPLPPWYPDAVPNPLVSKGLIGNSDLYSGFSFTSDQIIGQKLMKSVLRQNFVPTLRPFPP